MSVKAQAFALVFKFLETGLAVWEWDSIANKMMMAISWKCKTCKEKTVRWLTNMEDMDEPSPQTASFYVKVIFFICTVSEILKDIEEEQQHDFPKSRLVWNATHGGVDQHHQMYMEISPPHKIKYAWKHKLRAAMMSLTKNANIIFQLHSKKDLKKYKQGRLHCLFQLSQDKEHFMMAVISGIRTSKAIPQSLLPNPDGVIVYHQLTNTGKHGKQRKCAATLPTGRKCGEMVRDFCLQCGDIPLCKGLCSLRYHNPHMTVIAE
jgi:hypothetical protein